MTKSMKLLLLACSAVFLLSACDNDDDTDDNPISNIREAAKDGGLQDKTFRGECSLKPLQLIATGIATLGEDALKSGREQYYFEGMNVVHTTILYTSANCTEGESIVYTEKGSMEIDRDKKTDDGASYIDFKFEALQVKIQSEAGANIAHDVGLCGTQDWTVGVERDVTTVAEDLNCYRRKLPAHDANVYRLDDKTLYFGEKGLIERNEERPARLNMNEKYIAD